MRISCYKISTTAELTSPVSTEVRVRIQRRTSTSVPAPKVSPAWTASEWTTRVRRNPVLTEPARWVPRPLLRPHTPRPLGLSAPVKEAGPGHGVTRTSTTVPVPPVKMAPCAGTDSTLSSASVLPGGPESLAPKVFCLP